MSFFLAQILFISVFVNILMEGLIKWFSMKSANFTARYQRCHSDKEKLRTFQKMQCNKNVDINLDIYFTKFGAALTTILPILFKYCYKYCYSDSRNL
jgi:hypothetical protein